MSWSSALEEGHPCPECGVPRPRRPEAVVRSHDPAERVSSLVRMARDLLDVELAMLTEIRDDREWVRAHAGGWEGLPPLATASLPFEETYCRAMLDGEIDQLVKNTLAEPAVSELPLTRELGARAYLGVPIELSDAELYVLCCLANETRPGLGAREVKLMCGLAESVRAELTPR